MAVVEKKPEARTASPFDRLAVASLAGVVYVLASLAVAFKAVPALCRLVGLTPDTTFGPVLTGTLCVAALGVLAVVGFRLMGGTHSRPGLRAGVFLGLVFLAVWVLLSRWIGGLLEGWTAEGWLSNLGPTTGMGVAAVLSLLLGFWLLRVFLRPGNEKRILRLEEAGWFTFKTYKPGQGVRVRRGTILGMLLLGGSGIWVLLNHRVLERGSPDWTINIPFTDVVAAGDLGHALQVNLLDQVDTSRFRILSVGSAGDRLTEGETVPRAKVEEVFKPLVEQKAQKLQQLLRELKAREEKLRQTIKNQSELKARLPLEDDRARLESWIAKLEDFARDLAPEGGPESGAGKLKGQVFLIQKEIEKFVTAEQDSLREHLRTDQEAEKRQALKEEMSLIASWAHEEPLPVAAYILTRADFKQINAELDPLNKRVVVNPSVFADLKDTKLRFQANTTITRSEFDKAVEQLKKEVDGDQAKRDIEARARAAAPEARPVSGTTHYASILLLPAVKYTVPLLLLLLTVWVGWRIANLPTFADFLIATEAEMNKVSWTTRQRLLQDTVVVLVTMVMMALFLFVVDIGWAKLLSSKPIGVLKVYEKKEKPKDEKNLKW